MMSLGLIISPVMGSALYSIYGYSGTFYIVGAVSTIPGIIIYWKLPSKEMNGQMMPVAEQEQGTQLKKVTYFALLK